MPANSSRNTLVRQWELLKLLPSSGAGRTARELTELLIDLKFPVSKRQIERDLALLQEVLPIECNDSGMPYGWRWIKGAGVEVPGVSLADSVSLLVIEGVLRPLLPVSVVAALEPRLIQARRQLNALKGKQKNADWVDKVRYVSPSMSLLPPSVNEEVLEAVHTALLESRQLLVDYRSLESETDKEYRVHPVALVSRGAMQYLVAMAFDFDDMRFYALHRMSGATPLLNKVAKKPEGFNLDDFIKSGAFQFMDKAGLIVLQATVEPWLARVLKETPLSEDQEITEQGGVYKIKAKVNDSWQLRWWILSQGAGIRIDGPKKLKSEIANQLREALAQYEA